MTYLTRNMRINEAIEFIEPFASEDPTLVSMVCDSLLSVDKTKEAIIILGQKIKEYPMLVNLLLKQANSFIQYEYYEYALELSKVCVELCPESFECWISLAESYFHMRMFSNALICLDIAPFYSAREPDEQKQERYPEVGDLMMTNPRTQDSSGIFTEYMLVPEFPDFKSTKNEDAPKDNVD